KEFPYTHNWAAVAALHASLELIIHEGMENVYKRHENVAKYCRKRVVDMGLQLYPKKEEFCSPTVTAICIPSGWTWETLNAALRTHGAVFGGNFDKLAGKVFRYCHHFFTCFTNCTS